MNLSLIAIKITAILILLPNNLARTQPIISFDLIRSMCMKNFRNEMRKAGIKNTILHEKAVCDCFIKKTKEGNSFTTAKDSCKKILKLNII